MANVTVVTELPVVNAALLPELPADFTGKNYVMFNSKWHHAEEENVAALVLTAAARRGKWEPIPWSDIVALIENDWVRQMAFFSDFGSAVHRVADTGDIELIKLGDEDYLVPTPVLAETVKKAIVRYY